MTRALYRDADFEQKCHENQKVKEKIDNIINRQFTHGDNNEKLNCKHYLRTVRENIKGRIFYTYDYRIREADGRLIPVILDYDQNHDYQNSPYLKPEVYKPLMEKLAADFLAKKQADKNTAQQEPIKIPTTGTRLTVIGKEVIELDEAQGAIAAPGIMEGIAGSGKTCVEYALFEEFARAAGEGKKVLYVTQSERLAKNFREYWAASPYSKTVNSETVEILSYQALITKRHVGLELRQDAHEQGIAWLIDVMKEKKEKAELYYQEFRIISGFENKNGYLNAGDNLTEKRKGKEREEAFNLYNAWDKENDAKNHFYPEFFKSQLKDIYDLVLVDEAQDLSHLQLNILMALAKKRNILYSIDPKQNLFDVNKKTVYLQTRFDKYNLKCEPSRLKVSYRCPNNIMLAAKAVNDIRLNLLPKSKQEAAIELVEGPGSVPGEISWLGPWDKTSSKYALDLIQDLTVCVICDESDKEKLEQLRFPLVFTAKEIKGLQFETVILYNPLKKPIFREINKALLRTNSNESINKEDNLAFGPALCELFTGFTRSQSNLWIYQDSVDSVKELIRIFEKAKTNEPLPRSLKALTSEEAMIQARNYFEKDYLDQTKQILRTLCRKTEIQVAEQLKVWALEEAKKAVEAELIAEAKQWLGRFVYSDPKTKENEINIQLKTWGYLEPEKKSAVTTASSSSQPVADAGVIKEIEATLNEFDYKVVIKMLKNERKRKALFSALDLFDDLIAKTLMQTDRRYSGVFTELIEQVQRYTVDRARRVKMLKILLMSLTTESDVYTGDFQNHAQLQLIGELEGAITGDDLIDLELVFGLSVCQPNALFKFIFSEGFDFNKITSLLDRDRQLGAFIATILNAFLGIRDDSLFIDTINKRSLSKFLSFYTETYPANANYSFYVKCLKQLSVYMNPVVIDTLAAFADLPESASDPYAQSGLCAYIYNKIVGENDAEVKKLLITHFEQLRKNAKGVIGKSGLAENTKAEMTLILDTYSDLIRDPQKNKAVSATVKASYASSSAKKSGESSKVLNSDEKNLITTLNDLNVGEPRDLEQHILAIANRIKYDNLSEEAKTELSNKLLHVFAYKQKVNEKQKDTRMFYKLYELLRPYLSPKSKDDLKALVTLRSRSHCYFISMVCVPKFNFRSLSDFFDAEVSKDESFEFMFLNAFTSPELLFVSEELIVAMEKYLDWRRSDNIGLFGLESLFMLQSFNIAPNRLNAVAARILASVVYATRDSIKNIPKGALSPLKTLDIYRAVVNGRQSDYNKLFNPFPTPLQCKKFDEIRIAIESRSLAKRYTTDPLEAIRNDYDAACVVNMRFYYLNSLKRHLDENLDPNDSLNKIMLNSLVSFLKLPENADFQRGVYLHLYDFYDLRFGNSNLQAPAQSYIDAGILENDFASLVIAASRMERDSRVTYDYEVMKNKLEKAIEYNEKVRAHLVGASSNSRDVSSKFDTSSVVKKIKQLEVRLKNLSWEEVLAHSKSKGISSAEAGQFYVSRLMHGSTYKFIPEVLSSQEIKGKEHINWNTQDSKFGWSPLMMMCIGKPKNYIEAISTLINQEQVDLDLRDKKGMTAFMHVLTTFNDHVEMSKVLDLFTSCPRFNAQKSLVFDDLTLSKKDQVRKILTTLGMESMCKEPDPMVDSGESSKEFIAGLIQLASSINNLKADQKAKTQRANIVLRDLIAFYELNLEKSGATSSFYKVLDYIIPHISPETKEDLVALHCLRSISDEACASICAAPKFDFRALKKVYDSTIDEDSYELYWFSFFLSSKIVYVSDEKLVGFEKYLAFSMETDSIITILGIYRLMLNHKQSLGKANPVVVELLASLLHAYKDSIPALLKAKGLKGQPLQSIFEAYEKIANKNYIGRYVKLSSKKDSKQFQQFLAVAESGVLHSRYSMSTQVLKEDYNAAKNSNMRFHFLNILWNFFERDASFSESQIQKLFKLFLELLDLPENENYKHGAFLRSYRFETIRKNITPFSALVTNHVSHRALCNDLSTLAVLAAEGEGVANASTDEVFVHIKLKAVRELYLKIGALSLNNPLSHINLDLVKIRLNELEKRIESSLKAQIELIKREGFRDVNQGRLFITELLTDNNYLYLSDVLASKPKGMEHVNWNHQDSNGYTILMKICVLKPDNFLECIKVLLESGNLDLSLRDNKHGFTAFMHAALYVDKPEVLKLFTKCPSFDLSKSLVFDEKTNSNKAAILASISANEGLRDTLCLDDLEYVRDNQLYPDWLELDDLIKSKKTNHASKSMLKN